jgi:hypothetical protein
MARTRSPNQPKASTERESGTLPTASESAHLPVTESGLSVDPEDLGRQFLHDATEQDNFESSVRRDEAGADGVALGTVISEGSLRASMQEDAEVPSSGALDHSDDFDAAVEPSRAPDPPGAAGIARSRRRRSAPRATK